MNDHDAVVPSTAVEDIMELSVTLTSTFDVIQRSRLCLHQDAAQHRQKSHEPKDP